MFQQIVYVYCQLEKTVSLPLMLVFVCSILTEWLHLPQALTKACSRPLKASE